MSTFLDDADFESFEEPIAVPDDYEFLTHRTRDLLPLSPAAETLLAQGAQAGDPRCLEQLVSHNLPMVIRHATLFRPRVGSYRAGGLEYGDLVQEGMIGLQRAARSWNPASGTSFSTYALVAVERQMLSAISAQDDSIRVPREVRKLAKQISAIQEDRRANGLEPLERDELAAMLDTPRRSIDGALDAAQVTRSLDRPLAEDSSTTVGDLLMDPNAHHFADELFGGAADSYLPTQIHAALSKLKPREREILIKRHIEGKSLETTGQELGVSAERVRVQQRRGEGKLRRNLEREVRPDSARPVLRAVASDSPSKPGARPAPPTPSPPRGGGLSI